MFCFFIPGFSTAITNWNGYGNTQNFDRKYGGVEHNTSIEVSCSYVEV
jgi:hypothetical protein